MLNVSFCLVFWKTQPVSYTSADVKGRQGPRQVPICRFSCGLSSSNLNKIKLKGEYALTSSPTATRGRQN